MLPPGDRVSGCHVMPSTEYAGMTPVPCAFRWTSTGSPQLAMGVVPSAAVTVSFTAYVAGVGTGDCGVSVTTTASVNVPLCHDAEASESPEPTEPSAGGGGGGGVTAVPTTAPSRESLSMLIVTPAQVSLWPPLYWCTRW